MGPAGTRLRRASAMASMPCENHRYLFFHPVYSVWSVAQSRSRGALRAASSSASLRCSSNSSAAFCSGVFLASSAARRARSSASRLLAAAIATAPAMPGKRSHTRRYVSRLHRRRRSPRPPDLIAGGAGRPRAEAPQTRWAASGQDPRRTALKVALICGQRVNQRARRAPLVVPRAFRALFSPQKVVGMHGCKLKIRHCYNEF